MYEDIPTLFLDFLRKKKKIVGPPPPPRTTFFRGLVRHYGLHPIIFFCKTPSLKKKNPAYATACTCFAKHALLKQILNRTNHLKGKFSSVIEGALASTLNHDFNWKQLSEIILCFSFDVFEVYLSNIDPETAEI